MEAVSSNFSSVCMNPWGALEASRGFPMWPHPSYNSLLIAFCRFDTKVQNTAMQRITGTTRRNHISPILRQLHWLPVRYRVTFKIAVLHGLSVFNWPGTGVSG